MKKLTINETAEWFKSRDNFLLLTHIRPDGDTLCSAAGLAATLKKCGKTAYLLKNDGATERYLSYMGGYFAPEGYKYEYVVSVDIAGEGLFPENAEIFKGNVDLCVDHHFSNSGYAEESCVVAECAACGEIIYALAMALCGEIGSEIAKQLYIAVSTDTGCFAYANTTANTFRVAAKLTEAGAPNVEINKKLFRTKTRGRIALEGMIISGIRFYHGGKTAVAVITQEMLKKTGVCQDELDDLASIPGQIEGVVSGVTVKEQENGMCKISLRTMQEVNASRVCAEFGGGGHPMAAGCTIDEKPERAGEMIAEAIERVG